MTDGTNRLHLALTALHAGMATLAAEDGDLSLEPSGDAEDVKDAILRVVRSARAAEAMAKAAADMAQDMSARAARYKGRSERMRGIVLAAMDAIGERKLEGPDVTVSLTPGRAGVVVSDETVIPDAYWKQPPRVLDKKALGDDVKAGVVVPGAELSNGMPSLTVRSK